MKKAVTIFEVSRAPSVGFAATSLPEGGLVLSYAVGRGAFACKYAPAEISFVLPIPRANTVRPYRGNIPCRDRPPRLSEISSILPISRAFKNAPTEKDIPWEGRGLLLPKYRLFHRYRGSTKALLRGT